MRDMSISSVTFLNAFRNRDIVKYNDYGFTSVEEIEIFLGFEL